MAYQKAKSNTGTVFLKETEGKNGKFYAGTFPIGPVAMEINGDKDLVVKTVDGTELIKPKSNSYGDFYVAKVGDLRYFISKRSNEKGEYMMAKIAPEREVDSAGRPQRPESYGTRK